MFSALPSKADSCRRSRHVRFVPKPDSCAAAERLYSITSSAQVCAGSFGQPRFPKTLSQQLRVGLPTPGDPRRYCKGGIKLKHTRRSLMCLSIASEMGEGGRETAV